jgi:hypothetical protein
VSGTELAPVVVDWDGDLQRFHGWCPACSWKGPARESFREAAIDVSEHRQQVREEWLRQKEQSPDA